MANRKTPWFCRDVRFPAASNLAVAPGNFRPGNAAGLPPNHKPVPPSGERPVSGGIAARAKSIGSNRQLRSTRPPRRGAIRPGAANASPAKARPRPVQTSGEPTAFAAATTPRCGRPATIAIARPSARTTGIRRHRATIPKISCFLQFPYSPNFLLNIFPASTLSACHQPDNFNISVYSEITK